MSRLFQGAASRCSVPQGVGLILDRGQHCKIRCIYGKAMPPFRSIFGKGLPTNRPLIDVSNTSRSETQKNLLVPISKKTDRLRAEISRTLPSKKSNMSKLAVGCTKIRTHSLPLRSSQPNGRFMHSNHHRVGQDTSSPYVRLYCLQRSHRESIPSPTNVILHSSDIM